MYLGLRIQLYLFVVVKKQPFWVLLLFCVQHSYNTGKCILLISQYVWWHCLQFYDHDLAVHTRQIKTCYTISCSLTHSDNMEGTSVALEYERRFRFWNYPATSDSFALSWATETKREDRWLRASAFSGRWGRVGGVGGTIIMWSCQTIR
jgi:hypothetical protein